MGTHEAPAYACISGVEEVDGSLANERRSSDGVCLSVSQSATVSGLQGGNAAAGGWAGRCGQGGGLAGGGREGGARGALRQHPMVAHPSSG
jgi:hypothetical protein